MKKKKSAARTETEKMIRDNKHLAYQSTIDLLRAAQVLVEMSEGTIEAIGNEDDEMLLLDLRQMSTSLREMTTEI